MLFNIPLAWLQLTREKRRLLVAIAGISFADILMFLQIGFQSALFSSAVRLHNSLQGDIFLISSQSTSLMAMKSFSQRRLYQALAFPGTESSTSIYLNTVLWKNPYTRETRGILVLGFNPKESVMAIPEIEQNLDKIKIQDRVLFDAASRDQFGTKEIIEDVTNGKIVSTEVGSKRIEVAGLYKLGASFGADGTIVTSDVTFREIFPRTEPTFIDIGVVRVKPETDVEAVVKQMRQTLPTDITIFSKEEFVEFELNYWRTGTAIGFIFTLGTIMGFIVGIIIVYQILYTDVTDHLPEYATLKAMGYKDLYLLGVVLKEALILAVLGYFPGMGISFFLYNLTRNATSLPMIMTLSRALTVFILTVIMCYFSGAIAVRKLSSADPADIF